MLNNLNVYCCLGMTLLLFLIRASLACETSSDCSLNGNCVNSVCECSALWDGSNCTLLSLGPTDPLAGLHDASLSGAHLSTWGGSVVVDPQTGFYHMWASRMRGNCGIATWLSNSEIVHAVSTTGPVGRYTTSRVVWPLWAHEPAVTRAPTGEFVMYFSGNGGGEYPLAVNGGQECLSCVDGSTSKQCNGLGRNWSVPLLTWMSYAYPPPPGSPPDAPWNWAKPVLIPSQQPLIDTNMAGIILKNGTFVGLWRDNSGEDPGPSALHRVTAASWKDPSSYVESPLFQLPLEDPTIWVDSTSNSSSSSSSSSNSSDSLHLHVLLHRGVQGVHGFSGDGGWSWTMGVGGSAVAFEGTYILTNGSEVKVRRRERPHAVLNALGELVALTNAVQPVEGAGEGKDLTYTIAVPVDPKGRRATRG